MSVIDKTIIKISFFKLCNEMFSLEKPIILECVYMPCDGWSFYFRQTQKGGVVELDALLLCDIVNSEYDISLTGDFYSRTSNIDDFIPLRGAEHTSENDIYTVDLFNIPRQSVMSTRET